MRRPVAILIMLSAIVAGCGQTQAPTNPVPTTPPAVPTAASAAARPTASPLMPAAPTAPTAATPAPADQPTAPAASEGSSANAGALTLTVLGVATVTDAPVPADDGKRYVVVDLDIANHGDTEETVSSLLQLTLIDAQGTPYDESLFATGSDDGMPTAIPAGQRVHGKVGFEVPAAATAFTLHFDDLVGHVATIPLDVPVAGDANGDLGGAVVQEPVTLDATVAYTAPSGIFTIAVPATWEKAETFEDDTAMVTWQDPRAFGMLMVVLTRDPDGVVTGDSAAYLHTVVADLTEGGSAVAISEPVTQADGSASVSFTFTEPTAQQHLAGDATLQRDGDYASMLVVLTPLHQAETLHESLRAIRVSFVVNPAAPLR